MVDIIKGIGYLFVLYLFFKFDGNVIAVIIMLGLIFGFI
jgi:hypothetical protein